MKRVFLSFQMEDKKTVEGIRLMKWNERFDLEFYDESVRVAYKSTNADYIKRKIREKIERSSVTVGLLGSTTHQSMWVNWELETSIDCGNRIVLMGLPNGPQRLTLPSSVAGFDWYLWDPQKLVQLIG